MEEFFASCDAVLLSSRANSIEGLPNAVMEAMAMRRPVVATQVGGLTELVRHGIEGFLVPPDDRSAFAGHLVELLRDAQLRQSMGAAGRARIEDHFSEAKVMRLLVKVIEDAARTRSQHSRRDTP